MASALACLVALVLFPVTALSRGISPTVVRHELYVDEFEHGFVWTWADVAVRHWVLFLFAALFGGVGASVAVRRWGDWSDSPDYSSVVPVAISGATGGLLIAVFIANREANNSFMEGLIVVAVTLGCLLFSGLLKGRAGVVVHSFSASFLVAVVCTFQPLFNNGNHGLFHFLVSLGSLLLPLAYLVFGAGGRRVGWVLASVVAGAHLVVLAPVTAWANHCEGDCISVPIWLSIATVFAVWSLVARCRLRARSFSSTAIDRKGIESFLWPMVAIGPLPLVGILVGFAATVEMDADPTPLPATPPAVEAELPGIIGWTSTGPCPASATQLGVLGAPNAIITGRETLSRQRIEICGASFSEWSYPVPNAVIYDGEHHLLEPVSQTRSRMDEVFRVSQVEPDERPVRYRYEGGGAHRFYAVVDDRLLLEVRAGREYFFSALGFSDDGTWAFVVDSTQQLIVFPVDGSIEPTVLDDSLDQPHHVEWGPSVTFERSTSVRLVDKGSWIGAADPVEANDLLTALAARFEGVAVDFVLVNDRLHGRFIGLGAEEIERGLCARLNVWMNSETFDSNAYRSVATGDAAGRGICQGESRGSSCDGVLTLPTNVTREQLSGVDALNLEALVEIPITFPSFPDERTSLDLSNEEASMGPISATDLVEMSAEQVRCGPQPD